MADRCLSCGEPFTSTSHTEKNQNDKFKSGIVETNKKFLSTLLQLLEIEVSINKHVEFFKRFTKIYISKL